MAIVFRLTFSSAIVSSYRKYGSVGVVFAIMPLLIAIGVVIILGALLGVVWRERREHPLGEQPDSSAGSEKLQRQTAVPAPQASANVGSRFSNRAVTAST